MRISYQELKGVLYIFQTVLGTFLFIVAFVLLDHAPRTADPIAFIVPGITLLISGGLWILFGLETFFLREDPDVWR